MFRYKYVAVNSLTGYYGKRFRTKWGAKRFMNRRGFLGLTPGQMGVVMGEITYN